MVDKRVMKTIFKTAGAVLAAGITLAACGASSSSSTSTPHKPKLEVATYGWSVKVNPETGLQTLRLPHEGVATPTITKFASKDYAFYKEITNPKDWKYSHTFGQYIFVGPYTGKTSYVRVRDAKVRLMDLRYAILQFSTRGAVVPSKVGGFSYQTLGQWPATDPTLLATGDAQLQARYGTAALSAAVPSVGTIVEAPVGSVTYAEEANPKTYPTVVGVCVPHELALLDGSAAAFAAPYNAMHAIYSAAYGSAASARKTEKLVQTEGATKCAF